MRRWSAVLASFLAAFALVPGLACSSFGEAETLDASTPPDEAGGAADGAPLVDASPIPLVDCVGELGRFATHIGRVNVHTVGAGAWEGDPDCTSGPDVERIDYCKRFWPAARSARTPLVADKSPKPFKTTGCKETFLDPGTTQVACCP